MGGAWGSGEGAGGWVRLGGSTWPQRFVGHPQTCMHQPGLVSPQPGARVPCTHGAASWTPQRGGDPPDMQEQPLTVSLYSPRPVPEPRADAVPPLAHRHPLLPQQHLPHPAETPQVARGPAALRDPQRHPGHHPRPLQPGLPHSGRQQPAGPALDRAGQQRGEGTGTAPPAWGPFERGSQQPPNLSPWLCREAGATHG